MFQLMGLDYEILQSSVSLWGFGMFRNSLLTTSFLNLFYYRIQMLCYCTLITGKFFRWFASHRLHQPTDQLSAFHQLVWKNTNQVDEKINQFKVWKELLQPWMCKSFKSPYISHIAFLALWVFFSYYTCL